MSTRAAAEHRPWLRRHLPRALTIAVVVLFLGLLAYGVITTGESTRVDESLAKGEAPLAPGFELALLDPGTLPAALDRRLSPVLADDQLSLRELRGTPFVLNFWASWCIPCREEAPVLARGWEQHGPEGVLYLGLDMQDLTGDALDFIREFGIEYPTIREPGNTVAQAYGATGVPESYFVSGRGRIVGHVIGVVSARQLDQGAAAARKGRIVGTLSGGDIRSQR